MKFFFTPDNGTLIKVEGSTDGLIICCHNDDVGCWSKFRMAWGLLAGLLNVTGGIHTRLYSNDRDIPKPADWGILQIFDILSKTALPLSHCN
jgi:hypothetical protein